ncbi:cysteine desulfurase [Philodulcilactobacillus myokoensis]|uniref:Cysteine desulfurase n=1 Tax=Philodulcilactobacillus myokoensis TaxID=2929573 RepID=A0A9W6ESS6_9LACO|nr:cysteine desulfurase family protein [Philodulcilactobacillus myokoensis]GLB46658.1 cysteine desulfurase [Philodulcilactobacillus myokoensis]
MIYFDNSATTKINSGVLDTYNKVSQNIWGNPSSLHQFGSEAHNLLTQSRMQIAKLLNVSPGEILFTSGGTEGDNWAIKGTAMIKRKFGNHIITTSVEHAAVHNPVEQLKKLGFEITYLPVDKNGRVSVEDLKKAIRPTTILVSIMAVNNEIGTIEPVKAIGELLKKYPKITYHIDAIQGVAKGLENIIFNDRVDLVSFSGHKFHAPRGTGFNYKRDGKKIAPLMAGGGQERGLRSGTENLPGIAAMAKAFRLVMTNEDEKVRHQRQIKSEIFNHIKKFPNVIIFSKNDDTFAPHILCFAIKGVRGETVVHAFEKYGIYISTTSACSSRDQSVTSTLSSMHVDSSIAEDAVRISLDENNTIEEAKKFNQVFDQLYQQFSKLS